MADEALTPRFKGADGTWFIGAGRFALAAAAEPLDLRAVLAEGRDAGAALHGGTLPAPADLEYTFLTLALIESEQQPLKLRVEVRGRGERNGTPVEIGPLVMNIDGFDEAVRQMLPLPSASNH